jgi:hypothetical protein
MAAVLGFFGIGTQEIVLLAFLLLVMILPAWLSCKIASRAGFSPALGLLTLIPFGVLVYLAVLAFADWPALRRPRTRDEDVAYRP